MSSLVPALVGAAFSLAGLAGLYRGRGSAHWLPVAGTVVEVRVGEQRGVHGSDPTAVFHYAALHYSYVFNGQLYQGTRRLGGPVIGHANALQLGAAYLPGQRLDVFVDERRPDRHTLFRNEHRQWWWVIGFGLCWLALALWNA